MPILPVKALTKAIADHVCSNGQPSPEFLDTYECDGVWVANRHEGLPIRITTDDVDVFLVLCSPIDFVRGSEADLQAIAARFGVGEYEAGEAWTYGSLYIGPSGRTFEAQFFAKVVPVTLPPGTDTTDEAVRDFLFGAGIHPDHLLRLVYCPPEEATVVHGQGDIGGSLQPMCRLTLLKEVRPVARFEMLRRTLMAGDRVDFKYDSYTLAAWEKEAKQ